MSDLLGLTVQDLCEFEEELVAIVARESPEGGT